LVLELGFRIQSAATLLEYSIAAVECGGLRGVVREHGTRRLRNEATRPGFDGVDE
jgi:hypothetical protein